MHATMWFEHPAARLLAAALVHFLWQGTAIACALIVATEFCSMRRMTRRYACSVAALLAMAMCPAVTLCWFIHQSTGSGALAATDTEILSRTVLLVDVPPASAISKVPAILNEQLLRVQPYLLSAWLTGVLLFGTRLLVGAIGVARLRKKRLPLPPQVMSLVAKLGHRLRMQALPLVCLSRQVPDAMAAGLWRPLVLIPASWATEMPLEVLEAVIAHELAHLRRRDLWVNLLQRIVEALLFYHPAVWWLSRRLQLERELCADELAIAATGRRLAYVQALEHVAAGQRADIRPALAALMRGETNMRLLERVRHVLGQAPPRRASAWPAGIIALAIPAALWIAALSCGAALAEDDRDDRREAPRKQPARQEIAEDVTVEVVLRTEDDNADQAIKRGSGPKKVRVETERKPKPGAATEFFEEVVPRKIIRSGNKEELEIVTKDSGREARQIAELAAMVKKLTVQVERLTKQVDDLRRGESPSDQPKKTLTAPAIKAPAIAVKPAKAAAEAGPAREAIEREVRVQVERAEALKRAAEDKAEAVRRRAREQENSAREQQRQAEQRARDELQRAERELERAGKQQQEAEQRRERAIPKKAIVELEQLKKLDALQRVGNVPPAELKALLEKIEVLLRDSDSKLKEDLRNSLKEQLLKEKPKFKAEEPK